MTARELARDFPLRSALSRRAPDQVPPDEQLLELDEEMARRRRVYPGFVDRGTMAAEEAERHLAVWQAIIDDYRRGIALDRLQHAGRQAEARLHNDPPWRFTWDMRVRELRRELALRRTAYPKWIANPTNPLTAQDAQRKLERLDAVHNGYWTWLQHFHAPLAATHPDVAALPAREKLAHPVMQRQMWDIRNMKHWQDGFLPIHRAPSDGRPIELESLAGAVTMGHWTGRYWARGIARPSQPLDFQPFYFREQEQAA